MLSTPRRTPKAARGLLAAALLLSSCSRGGPPPVDSAAPPPPPAVPAGPPPAASVDFAAGSAWFELGPGGPVAVVSPEDASLVPFEPWPYARRLCGFLPDGTAVVAASNRDGFLSFRPGPVGVLEIFFHGNEEACAPYSMSEIFLFDGKPTVSLYRDRFFLDPQVLAPAVRALSLAEDAAVPVDPAAFALFPPEKGWDIDGVDRAFDGTWLVRAARDGSGEGRVAFASASSLEEQARPLSAAAHRAGLRPRPKRTAAPAMANALAAAAAARGSTLVASVAGRPGEGAVRFSSAENDAGAEKAWAWEGDRGAAVLLADGRCWLSGGDGAVQVFSLPELPGGFAYTGLARAGDAWIAAWEEQDGWAVGAAGFLVLRARGP